MYLLCSLDYIHVHTSIEHAIDGAFSRTLLYTIYCKMCAHHQQIAHGVRVGQPSREMFPVSCLYLDCYLPLHRTGAPHILNISSLQQWCTYPLQPGLGYIIHPCHGAGQSIFAFCLSLPKHYCATHHNRICIPESDPNSSRRGAPYVGVGPLGPFAFVIPRPASVFFFFFGGARTDSSGKAAAGKEPGKDREPWHSFVCESERSGASLYRSQSAPPVR